MFDVLKPMKIIRQHLKSNCICKLCYFKLTLYVSLSSSLPADMKPHSSSSLSSWQSRCTSSLPCWECGLLPAHVWTLLLHLLLGFPAKQTHQQTIWPPVSSARWKSVSFAWQKTFAEHNQRWKGDIICNHPTVIEYIVSVLKKKRKKSQMLLFTTWWWWLRPHPVEWFIDRYTWSLQSEAWSPALSMQQGQGLQQRNPAFNDCSLYFYDPVQHWLFCCDFLL